MPSVGQGAGPRDQPRWLHRADGGPQGAARGPELPHRRVGIGDIRDIDVTDLLGRHQIDTDVDAIAGYLTGKRVLVTGAGGSIGSELCRQIDRVRARPS